MFVRNTCSETLKSHSASLSIHPLSITLPPTRSYFHSHLSRLSFSTTTIYPLNQLGSTPARAPNLAAHQKPHFGTIHYIIQVNLIHSQSATDITTASTRLISRIVLLQATKPKHIMAEVVED